MKKSKISNYRGIFSKDMLPTRIQNSESLIINLQDFFKGDGSQWVAVYNDSKIDIVEYFDSFGLKPPVECIQYMKTSSKAIEYSSSQIQILIVLCAVITPAIILLNVIRADNLLISYLISIKDHLFVMRSLLEICK